MGAIKLEVTSNAAKMTYKIENMNIMGVAEEKIKRSVNVFKKMNSFPRELEYIESFYDKETGSSGVLFENNIEGNFILAYTGTNLADGAKDIYTDIVGICMGQGEHYKPCYDFYERVRDKYGEDIILTGHSLGGNIAMRVALEYNVSKTVVYNGAPLYMIGGVDLFMNTSTVTETYKKRKEIYEKNVIDIDDKIKNFTGNIYRMTSESDIFTRISNLTDTGFYVGEEVIFKNSGLHTIKGFMDDNQKNILNFFEGNYEGEFLGSEYLPLSANDFKAIVNIPFSNADTIEEQIKNFLAAEGFKNIINNKVYEVDVSNFIDLLLEKLEQLKIQY